MNGLTPFDLSRMPSGTQLAMTGEEWISDRDRKSLAKAQATRKREGLQCAKKLEQAAEALRDYLQACRECQDNSGDEVRGMSDQRNMMISDLYEYSHWLKGRYE